MALTVAAHDGGQENGNTIELTLRNFSLSIIPAPSLLTRVARKLKITSNPNKNPPVDCTNASANGREANSNSNSNMSKNDRDLRGVGINIFRDVDLTVKPGQ
ncbi:hypothetical protein BG004_001764, partial [Podila humilis]